MENNYTELYEKLSHLQWLLGRQHMKNRMQGGPFADPSRGQGRVLAMLKLQPEISTKDLSYVLGIKQQSLNELLNKLEKGEYIVREPSEKDRRVMMVKLTEKGSAQQQEEKDYSGIFDCLSPEEQKTFGEYLDRVIDALEKEIGVEDEDMEQWVEKAHSRFGREKLAHMMAMGGRLSGEKEREFFEKFGHDPGSRGPAPGEKPFPDEFFGDHDHPFEEMSDPRHEGPKERKMRERFAREYAKKYNKKNK